RQTEPGNQHQVLRAGPRVLRDDDRVRYGADRGVGAVSVAAISAHRHAGTVRRALGPAVDPAVPQLEDLQPGRQGFWVPVRLPHVCARWRLSGHGPGRGALWWHRPGPV